MPVLILLLGCSLRFSGPDDSALEVGGGEGISTTARVEFTTPEEATCFIELGPEVDEYRYRTAAEASPGVDHQFLVAGFPAAHTSHWRTVCEGPDGPELGEDQVHDPGALPTEIPDFEVEDLDPVRSAGGYRIIPALGEVGMLVIVNAEGELVWWTSVPEGSVALAAYPSADGLGVWWNTNPTNRTDTTSTLEYSDWSALETRTIPTPLAHHDFALLPNGAGFAYIEADFREVDGASVAGDNIVLIDAAGGTPRRMWSAWEALPIPNFSGCRPSFYPTACDWTHANTLAYDAASDGFFLSLHQDSTLVAIDRAGTTRYFLGSSGYADYPPANAIAAFTHQHGIKPWPGSKDTFVLFDNGADETQSSRALRVKIGADERFTADWEFEWDGTHKSQLLGDADPVGAEGNLLVSWGSEGVVTEVTDDGQIVFNFGFLLGTTTGFVSTMPTMGGPL